MSHIPAAIPISLVSPVVIPPGTVSGPVVPVPIPVSVPSEPTAPLPIDSVASSMPRPISSDIPVPSGPPTHAEQQQALDLSSYVYNAGFVHAAWADTFLTINPHPPLRLHALFVSRSPLLYRYLSSYVAQGPPYHINISIDDPHVTTPALSIALAMLYCHHQDLTSCNLELAKGLVATGSLLGLDNVSGIGYSALLNALNNDTLLEVLDFILAPRPANQLTHAPAFLPDYDNLDVSYEGPYPPVTDNLMSIFIDYLFNNFSVQKSSTDPVFESVLLRLPFNIYKFVLENDALVVRTAMERHQFATQITGQREQRRKLDARSGEQTGPVYEESVVMSFGGGNDGMRIIRKQTGKRKTLWKANQ